MAEPPVLEHRQPRDEPDRSALARISMAVLLLVFIALFIQINRRISSGHSGDFRHFHFAAGALLDHRDLYGPVPDDVVRRALRRPMGTVEKAWYTTDTDRYLYPPFIAMLYTPIARLRFDTAQRLILFFNVALIFVGIVLTTRSFIERFQLPQTTLLFWSAALLGTLLNVDKIHVELQMFQTNSLIFFLFATSLFLLDRNPVLAGVPLGIIFNIKYLSIGIFPWLVIRRRWGTACAYAASIVIFALLPAVISGWHTNLQNLTVAYGGLLHMLGLTGSAEQANVDDIRDYLSCSITSAMARTTARGQSLLLPMIYSAAVAVTAVAVVIWRYIAGRMPVLAWPDAETQKTPPWQAMIGVEFVCMIAATLCFSPQTNTRHLMLALLMTIPISVLLLGIKRSRQKIWLAAAAAVLAVGFIFPPGGQASRQLALHWFGIGGQCWCLLASIFVLVWVVTAREESIRSQNPS